MSVSWLIDCQSWKEAEKEEINCIIPSFPRFGQKLRRNCRKHYLLESTFCQCLTRSGGVLKKRPTNTTRKRDTFTVKKKITQETLESSFPFQVFDDSSMFCVCTWLLFLSLLTRNVSLFLEVIPWMPLTDLRKTTELQGLRMQVLRCLIGVCHFDAACFVMEDERWYFKTRICKRRRDFDFRTSVLYEHSWLTRVYSCRRTALRSLTHRTASTTFSLWSQNNFLRYEVKTRHDEQNEEKGRGMNERRRSHSELRINRNKMREQKKKNTTTRDYTDERQGDNKKHSSNKVTRFCRQQFPSKIFFFATNFHLDKESATSHVVNFIWTLRVNISLKEVTEASIM